METFNLKKKKLGGAKGPGIFFVIPCVDNYCKVDLRTVSFDVPPQEVRLCYRFSDIKCQIKILTRFCLGTLSPSLLMLLSTTWFTIPPLPSPMLRTSGDTGLVCVSNIF